MDRKRNKGSRHNIIHVARLAKDGIKKFYILQHYEHMKNCIIAHNILNNILKVGHRKN